jgi:beta-lactamase regulating signal transducer with metallopeptidase domain
VLIGGITFIIIFIVAVIVISVFGAIGPYEFMLVVAVALAAAFIAERRDARRRSTVA